MDAAGILGESDVVLSLTHALVLIVADPITATLAHIGFDHVVGVRNRGAAPLVHHGLGVAVQALTLSGFTFVFEMELDGEMDTDGKEETTGDPRGLNRSEDEGVSTDAGRQEIRNHLHVELAVLLLLSRLRLRASRVVVVEPACHRTSVDGWVSVVFLMMRIVRVSSLHQSPVHETGDDSDDEAPRSFPNPLHGFRRIVAVVPGTGWHEHEHGHEPREDREAGGEDTLHLEVSLTCPLTNFLPVYFHAVTSNLWVSG